MSITGLSSGLTAGASGLYGSPSPYGVSGANSYPGLGSTAPLAANPMADLNLATGGSLTDSSGMIGMVLQIMSMMISLLSMLMGGGAGGLSPQSLLADPAGVTGATGTSGTAGTAGTTGTTGTSGTAGDAGNAGDAGDAGNAGNAGEADQTDDSTNPDPADPMPTPATNPNPSPTGGTNSGGGPDSIMGDFSSLALQLPSGQDGSPDTVKGNDIKNSNSQFFQYSDGKMTFHAPVNGVKTTNSNYPRSELGQQNGWKLSTGPHDLSATVSVDQAPSTKDIVIGQLHEKSLDGAKPRPPIELHWKDGQVVASVLDSDTEDAKRHDVVIADNVPQGSKFSYDMNVSPDGKVKITADGKTQDVQLDSSFNSRDLYFKAGAYVQDNEGGADEGGTVSFYGLNMN